MQERKTTEIHQLREMASFVGHRSHSDSATGNRIEAFDRRCSVLSIRRRTQCSTFDRDQNRSRPNIVDDAQRQRNRSYRARDHDIASWALIGISLHTWSW